MKSIPGLHDWLQDKPLRADVLTTLVVLILAVANTVGFGSDPDDRDLDVLGYALVVIPSLLVFFRRTHTLWALIAGTTVGFLYWILDYPNGGAFVAIMVLLYSAALYIDDRRRATVVITVFTIALLLVLITGYLIDSENDVTLGLIILNMIMFELAWLAGDGVRHRRTHLSDLESQMHSAREEHGRRTANAVAEERNRIARDLHDIVAHSMSVVVVQAEAAKRLVGRDDESVRDALGAIESTGRQSLTDIRGLVGLLRSDEDRAPAPELAMLDSLVEQCGEAGLPVSITVKGEKRMLPPMIELSGYRIVQESLTNAIKHAGPNALAEVTLDYGPDSLEISVVDNGRGAAADISAAGHGLLGMRERVEAFGGWFHTGPRPGGGYEVEARLPVAVG